MWLNSVEQNNVIFIILAGHCNVYLKPWKPLVCGAVDHSQTMFSMFTLPHLMSGYKNHPTCCVGAWCPLTFHTHTYVVSIFQLMTLRWSIGESRALSLHDHHHTFKGWNHFHWALFINATGLTGNDTNSSFFLTMYKSNIPSQTRLSYFLLSEVHVSKCVWVDCFP